jgi:cytochrome P450
VATYTDTMSTCAEEVISAWQDDETRDIANDMMTVTANILYRTILGVHAKDMRIGLRTAISTLQRFAGEMVQRTPQMSEVECEAARTEFDLAFAQLLEQERGGDLLSLLLQTGMPVQQIRDEMVTMMAAGQESSAHGLAWMWYLLGQYPQAQEQIYHEVLDVVGTDPLTSAHLEKLPVTVNIVREALRLYPPAWLIGRRPVQPVVIDDYTISPDDTIIVSPFVLHHTEVLFPDAECFKPERFAIEPTKYTYLPFGAGPHVCIGQSFAMLEMLTVLVTVIQDWRIELSPDAVVEWQPLVTLQPKYGIRVVLHKR